MRRNSDKIQFNLQEIHKNFGFIYETNLTLLPIYKIKGR